MGIKPIALSFKNSEQDMELYKWISSHSNMSGFIKDTLRDVKDGAISNKNNKPVKEVKEKKLIDMDF